MLQSIFIAPPLAFARVGKSSQPCDAFLWGANDVTPHGSGTTTLQPAETLDIAADGTASSRMPGEILFRDHEGIRPVCPFFELHGQWSDADGATQTGPLTAELLAQWGISLADVEWKVELGNLKAFHYTFDPGDRVEAVAAVKADLNTRVPVRGHSPSAATAALIRAESPMPMGTIQAVKPSAEFPELRLRFYAPAGEIYGPEDFVKRMDEMDFDAPVQPPNTEWRGFSLDPANLIVNPAASWPRYVPSRATLGPFFGEDNRNTPSSLLAAPYSSIDWLEGAPVLQRALGLVDDVSDGFVRCTLKHQGQDLMATARVVVGPPDFAPANRPPVSLADNLADREDRGAVREADELSRAELGELVLDILERALETSDLMHRDYQNFRAVRTNMNELAEAAMRSPFDADDLRAMLWPVPTAVLIKEGRVGAMALSEAGTWKHRRYAALEYLEDRFRENPALFEQMIRRPCDPNGYYDRRMPALMRGSDGRPLHVTRRQWEIFRRWIASLRENTSAAGANPGDI